MKISKFRRDSIRMMFAGRCAYCGCELPEKGWQVDHVKPVIRQHRYVHGSYEAGKYVPPRLVANGKLGRPDLDTEENLFPCCRACNIHKGVLSLGEWRKDLEGLTGVLFRNYPTYRHALRFGQIVQSPTPVVFWFERFSEGPTHDTAQQNEGGL
jgi:5-methylcytosine-specific restriction endonuclease McrA